MGSGYGNKFLVQRYIKPYNDMYILDIGCGTASILDYFPENIQYFGFDPNPCYIEHAKKKYPTRGQFMCEVVERFHITNPTSFDLVLAKGILHHLDDVQVKTLTDLADVALKPGGRLITLDCCYISKQNPVAKFLIKKDRGKNVRTPDAYLNLVRKEFKIISSSIINYKFIPYTLFIMECQKS
jgi:SAM-dependent methyltransferase